MMCKALAFLVSTISCYCGVAVSVVRREAVVDHRSFVDIGGRQPDDDIDPPPPPPPEDYLKRQVPSGGPFATPSSGDPFAQPWFQTPQNSHPALQGATFLTAGKPRCPKVAFLVRTYAPTGEMTKRIAQWVSSLQSSSDVDAFISIDGTHKHNVSPLLTKLRSTGFNLGHIHRYTTDDMLQAYPALKGKSYQEAARPDMHGLTLGYHTPAIDLFVQTLPQKHLTYDYLWVLEDDVGYTGDISKFLEAYSGSADDLISGSKEGSRKAGSFHAGDQTDAYKERVPSTQRIHSEEHVTRMSARLLGKLHDWMVAGAIDSSEVMPATVCSIEHMQCSCLKEEDLGSPYTWDHSQAIESKAVWEAIQSNDAAAAHPRLYHAVKV